MSKTKTTIIWMTCITILALAISYTSCGVDDERPPISQPIQTVCLNKVGNSIFIYDDQILKSGDVYRFRYTSIDNCDAKFLGTELMISPTDTLCLCEEKQVGEAFFVLDSIQVLGSLVEYHFLQRRETFQGVFNNDAVCDRYANSFDFHMTYMDTPGIYNLGDTIYLGHN